MTSERRKQVRVVQRVRLAALAAAAWAALLSTAAAQPDLIARARLLYNLEQYEQAIAVAEKARLVAETADAAALVIARARLERYRRTGDAEDLQYGRQALREIRPDALMTARDRIEYLVGVGEALFLEGQHGPAAELFSSALANPSTIDPALADRILDWWASALDRKALALPQDQRAPVYRRIFERLEEVARRDPYSAAATYWLAASARGLGDLDRAWDLATAGWAAAPLVRQAGSSVRADIDRLVSEALIPERAHMLGVDEADRQRLENELTAAWKAFKEQWTRR
ncbi:MAG: hypothetical protein ACE148_17380 [Vicinamibacterales bacterium]